MDDPAFQQRIACDGKGKRWIELNGPRVELFALFEFLKLLHRVGKIVRLNKSEVSLTVFCRLAFHSRLFRGRKFRLERIADFLGEVSLDGKDIGYIAIVIARPNVLVAIRIDQLHVYPHLVAGAADTAFKNVRDPELLTNIANIRSLSAIGHDGSARDHFEFADFRKIGQNVVLYSISKESVLLVVAQIFEWQYRDRFVQLARRCPWQEEEAGHSRHDHADCQQNE